MPADDDDESPTVDEGESTLGLGGHSGFAPTMFALAVAGLSLSTVSSPAAHAPPHRVFSAHIASMHCHPRALVKFACGTFGSVLLYYIFANASGVGHGVVGGRGGTGDHLWGQLIYQCSLWEDDMPTSVSGLSSTNAKAMSAQITHDTCVNSAQLTSLITAVMGGWIATAHFVWTEEYVLWFPAVHHALPAVQG